MFFKCIFLGMVQGFTEFLPVSSSGHLVVFSSLIGFELSGGEEVFFDIMLHMGTLFAVIVCLRKEIFQMLKNPFSKPVAMLIVASIPAVVVGVVFGGYIEGFFDASCVFVGFYFTAFILLFCDSFAKSGGNRQLSYKSVASMGVMQGLALIPGVSRSGSTLLGGVYFGVEKSEVAKFSFLMSVPVILGSAILKSFEFSQIGISGTLILCSVCGGISAFLFGVLGIRFFLRVLQKVRLAYFSYYLFALATIVMFACS